MPDTLVAPFQASIRVERLPPLARLLLRGDPAVLGPAFQLDLPTTACTAQAGEHSALWLGPDEWLVLAPAGTRWPEWRSDHGAAIDVGHRQTGFAVAGAAAEAALAVGCPLDLHPTRFPEGSCTRTVFGKAEIVLWRRERDLFHLETGRSFAAYVGHLLDIGAIDAE